MSKIAEVWGVFRKYPWESVEYFIAWFPRRWMVTLWSLAVFPFIINAPWWQIICAAALAWDLLVTPKARDVNGEYESTYLKNKIEISTNELVGKRRFIAFLGFSIVLFVITSMFGSKVLSVEIFTTIIGFFTLMVTAYTSLTINLEWVSIADKANKAFINPSNGLGASGNLFFTFITLILIFLKKEARSLLGAIASIFVYVVIFIGIEVLFIAMINGEYINKTSTAFLIFAHVSLLTFFIGLHGICFAFVKAKLKLSQLIKIEGEKYA